MSSEALREAFDWLEAISSADPKLVRPSGLAAALLAEVARLEQELAIVERVSQRNANAHMAVHRALAVAREREQRAVEALGCAEYALMTGARETVDEALALIRAALVDEPAAGGEGGGRPDGVAVADSQHREHGPRPDRPPAAATMAVPGRYQGGTDGEDSASAAADEPGETPTSSAWSAGSDFGRGGVSPSGKERP